MELIVGVVVFSVIAWCLMDTVRTRGHIAETWPDDALKAQVMSGGSRAITFFVIALCVVMASMAGVF